MGSRRKPSFIIKDPREPRRVAAVRALADKRAAGARQPTRDEIIDLAIALARDEYDMEWPLVELFHWPASAPPCRDQRKLFLPVVETFMKKAAEELRRHYAYYHALELRRKRWLRAHPRPRGWVWTRKPLGHSVLPPRRRIFRPPDLDDYPDGLSPPLPATGIGSAKRPCRRETERLLWDERLFDNGIVVSTG